MQILSQHYLDYFNNFSVSKTQIKKIKKNPVFFITIVFLKRIQQMSKSQPELLMNNTKYNLYYSHTGVKNKKINFIKKKKKIILYRAKLFKIL